MSVRIKCFLVLLLVIAALILAQFQIMRQAFSSVYLKQEKASARRNMERVVAALNRQMGALSELGAIVARHVAENGFDQKPEGLFAGREPRLVFLNQSRPSLIAIIDKSARKVSIPEVGPGLPGGKAFSGMGLYSFWEAQGVLGLTAKPDGRAGVLPTDKGPLLTCASPVMPEGSGPPLGMVVLGRLLTGAQMKKLSGLSGQPVTVRLSPTTANGPKIEGRAEDAVMPNGEYQVEQGPGKLVARALFPGLSGRPALLVSLEAPFKEFGAHIPGYENALYASLAAGLILLIIGFLLIDLLLVRPLHALTKYAVEAAEQWDSPQPISYDRTDEIGVLSRAVGQAAQKMSMELSEKSRDRQSLEESEEKYRSISSGALDAIIMLDPNGKIIFWNPAAEDMFGYTPDEAKGKDLHLLLAPSEYHEKYLKGQAEFKLNGTGQAVGKTMEMYAIAKHGKRLRVELSMASMRIRGDWCAVGIVRDVTQRTEAESALRKSEEKYRITFNNVPYSLCITEVETGMFLEVNQGFEEVTGYTREEAIGRTTKELGLYHKPEARLAVVGLLKREGVVKNEPFIMQRKNGELRHALVSMNPFLYQGKNCMISTVQDVDEKVRAEESREKLQAQLLQSQKMEAVGVLAGGVAHDFNNILQAITGYTQMLNREKSLDQNSRARIEAIDNAAMRASLLVKRLLTFSRRVEPVFGVVDLRGEIKAAVDILRHTLPKMIGIETNLAPDLKHINGDAVQMEQLLMNLANNARDAMPGGGVLTISARNMVVADNGNDQSPLIKPGEYVELTVKDTGAGMDEKTLERIFEPFYTKKEIGKGSGLGLSIVYGIVEGHGGRIQCTSALGKGTTFQVYLPAAAIIAEGKRKKGAEAADPLQGSEVVLMVEDEESILKTNMEMLELYGYKPIGAGDGEEAIDLFGKMHHKIDLVVMDLGMPGMGGGKCIKELAAIDPEVRIIVASGYSKGAVSPELTGASVVGFVPKPYRLTDLLRKIRRVLD